VEIEVAGVFSGLEEALGFDGGFGPMVTRERPRTSILPEDGAAKKSEMQRRRPSFWRGK